jgi:hypothetical protein
VEHEQLVVEAQTAGRSTLKRNNRERSSRPTEDGGGANCVRAGRLEKGADELVKEDGVQMRAGLASRRAEPQAR